MIIFKYTECLAEKNEYKADVLSDSCTSGCFIVVPYISITQNINLQFYKNKHLLT